MEPILTGLTTAVAFAIIVWGARFARRWFDAYRGSPANPARINERRALIGQPPLKEEEVRAAKRKRRRRSLRSAFLRNAG